MRLAEKILSLVLEDKPDPNKNYTMWKVTTGEGVVSVRTSLGKKKFEAIEMFRKRFPQVFNVILMGNAVDGVYTEVSKAESLDKDEVMKGSYTLFDGEELKKIG